MKIHEYNEMMSYLTRPAQAIDRLNKAIGGGVIQGEDLGTREGFNRPLIPVSELPKDQQKFINNWLKNNPGKKWEELTNNQRNMLKKGQNVGIGYGAATPKGEDNPLFEPLDEEGKKIAKKVYGTTDISKDKRLRINSGEITMDTKPVKFEKGKDISLKMKRGSETVTDVVFPDKKMEKDFIKAIRARVLQPQKAVVDFSNKELAQLFPISEKQAGRAAKYFINKLNLKYATVPSKTSADIIKNTKNLIKQTSSFLQENRIRSAKTNILQDLNLQKKMDTAHRVSKTHMAKLGLEFNTDLMGIDSRLINQIIVKPSEIQLDRLYRKQYDIFEKLKKNPDSTELKNNLKDINKQVTDIVKNTSGRLVGVTIDPDTLETSFQGIKKKYSFSNVLGDSMTMKELENIPKEDQVKFLTKQLPKAIDLEVKRGFVPNDFKNILSNKESQKAILNYAKQKAPELIAPLKKAFLNPASKASLKLFSQFPAIAATGLVGVGAYKTMGFGKPVLADDMSGPVDPGVAVPQEQFDPEKADPTLGTAVGAYGAYKYGPQLLKLLKNVGKGAIRTVASPVVAAGYAGTELASEDPNLALAGAELLYPEIAKRTVGQAPKGFITNVLGLQGLAKYGRLGALAARVPTAFTPVGAGLIGLDVGKRLYDAAQAEQQRLESLTPYQRQIEQEDFLRESAAYGGRMGFADGPEDPSKRKFMKIMGGLASLPIVGRFIKIGEQAPAALEAAKGMPEWFGTLVDKVIKTGTDATKRFATKDREEVFEKFMGEEEGVRVYRDLEKGDIKVEYFSPDNMGGTTSSVDMIYKAPEQLEDGKVVPADFRAIEAEPRGIRSGPDDYDIEFDGENVVENIDDLNSDLGRLEFFATDKMPDLKKIEKSNEKRRRVQNLNEDQQAQAEYLETKYGAGEPGDPYVDYSDYD